MEYVEQIDMLIGRFRVTLRRENGTTVVTIGASQFLNECAAFVQNKKGQEYNCRRPYIWRRRTLISVCLFTQLF